MERLAAIIRGHHAEIIEDWTREAQRAAAARGLSGPAFTNFMPRYLSAIADAGEELGRFSGRRRELVEGHLATRLRQGFDLAEIVEEFALLGRCIARAWLNRPREDRPEEEAVERLFTELHLTSIAVAEMFTRHMREDEQADKRYIRLIQEAASRGLLAGEASLRERLREIVAIIMEAMGTQSAAILLYNPRTATLEFAAAAGVGCEEMERYASSLALSSFAGQIAASEETTSMRDVATTQLEVNGGLRRSGIHSLLGVRLPPRRKLLGVLYVGLVEIRPFTAREVRRLENLGEHLTLHLDNARLYAELLDRVAELQTERRLREQFVSVLAHDLRGPLSVAKMQAQVLKRVPERLDERRDMADAIDRSLGRVDRMISDLLDASRLRAGQRMPLHIEECDLGAVAQQATDELIAAHGDRFLLRVEPGVRGHWGADELRRALWNLGTNAVKYGTPEAPITVSVRATATGAELAVHNEGAPIAPEEAEQLFQPFSRTRSAQAGGKPGWGLGLALVRACAEAHGGRATVHSAPGAGTTFTLELPPDARPFQAESAATPIAQVPGGRA